MRKFLFQIINTLLFGSDPLVSNMGGLIGHRIAARKAKAKRDKLTEKAAQEQGRMSVAAENYRETKLLINKDLEQLF